MPRQKTIEARAKRMVSLLNLKVVPEFKSLFKCNGDLFGMRMEEAVSIQEALKDKSIHSVAEVGRYYGGSTYLWSRLFNLRKILSIDIRSVGTENALRAYFDSLGVENEMLVCNSTSYKSQETFDFVFIDGRHTVKSCFADIEIWKNHCRFICFHDYTDELGSVGRKYLFSALVDLINEAAKSNGWIQIGKRAHSEIIFQAVAIS